MFLQCEGCNKYSFRVKIYKSFLNPSYIYYAYYRVIIHTKHDRLSKLSISWNPSGFHRSLNYLGHFSSCVFLAFNESQRLTIQQLHFSQICIHPPYNEYLSFKYILQRMTAATGFFFFFRYLQLWQSKQSVNKTCPDLKITSSPASKECNTINNSVEDRVDQIGGSNA